MFRSRVPRCLAAASSVLLALGAGAAAAQPQGARSGQVVYDTICTTCHGPDGRGGVNPELERVVVPPDFTDCAFANREPDRAFLAVAHEGGPSRGFSPLMPAWGAAFTEEELAGAIAHMRTFCRNDAWPRGELNLPLALVTNKAFPEDEAVVKVTSQSGSMTTKVVYERRFGALNQWEIALPFSSIEDAGGGSARGLGDIALGYKRVLAHSFPRGHIVSASAEVKLPTGRESEGLGGGVAVFEPFVSVGQILPGDGFLQLQGGFGLPMESGHEREAFWRAAIGKTFAHGRFGRMWSPFVEVLAARSLVQGARVEWDVLPAMQVTLNRRQHVRVAGGVRLPVTDAGQRSKSAVFYLLWDWYEGGFFQGW